MAGRKPLPTNLKVLRNTAQPCRMNENEPKVPACKIEMPDGLSDMEQRHWQLVSRDLEECGILTKIDVHAFKLYCNLYATWENANDNLKKYGSVIKDKRGVPCLSPYFQISMKAMDKMLNFLREFGMTPSSRTKVIVTTDLNPSDEMAMFLKRCDMAHNGV